MSGSIAPDNEVFFFEEATPSGSGQHPRFDNAVGGRFSESPLGPPPTEDASATSASYAIPAAVIVVSIAALFLMIGGLKVCAHLRRQAKRRNHYFHSSTAQCVNTQPNANSFPLMKPFLSAGYKSCPHEWSAISVPMATEYPFSGIQRASLREAVRRVDAIEERSRERESNIDAEMAEITSMGSSTYGDDMRGAQQVTVVEVEVHP